MTPQEIVIARDNIYLLLSQRKLKEAFRALHALLLPLNEWSYNEELEQLETSYRYMIQYMLDGFQDPERKNIYNALVLSSYSLTDTVVEAWLSRHSSHLYYSKQRAISARADYSLACALDKLDDSISQLSLSQLLGEQEISTDNTLAIRRKCERELSDIFVAIWTLPLTTNEAYEALTSALEPQRYNEQVLCNLVAAVTLHQLQYYNEQLLHWLLDAYTLHPSQEVKQRAICGALLTIYTYQVRVSLSKTLLARVDTLKDEAAFRTDARHLFLQFIKTRETEKIARKLTEELLPEMMKLDPTIHKKIREEDASLDKNPEWMEVLGNSPLADKLRELTELQMEGADVFMTTFSQLKRYTFFDNIANWFLLFSPTHSTLASLFDGTPQEENFKRTLDNSVFLCNSDKYSFVMSILQMPKEQRTLMMSQFDMEAEGMKESLEEGEYTPLAATPEHISNQYIQDLYRFFRLFARKDEFVDPFAQSLNLYEVEPLKAIFDEPESLLLIGEYYFRKEYYSEALQFYRQLALKNSGSSELYQKLGYCYQMLGNHEMAVENLLRADIITPNNLWTLRHVATCYRHLKMVEKALIYYSRAEKVDPENLSIQLSIGHCYLELNEYEDALKHYFKVEYLSTNPRKAWRPIAWCSFLLGNLEKAQSYYSKLLDDRPTATDYLNAAHVAFASSDIRQAIEYYRASIVALEGGSQQFMESFEQDTPDLIRAGVSASDIPILLDQLMYEA